MNVNKNTIPTPCLGELHCVVPSAHSHAEVHADLSHRWVRDLRRKLQVKKNKKENSRDSLLVKQKKEGKEKEKDEATASIDLTNAASNSYIQNEVTTSLQENYIKTTRSSSKRQGDVKQVRSVVVKVARVEDPKGRTQWFFKEDPRITSMVRKFEEGSEEWISYPALSDGKPATLERKYRDIIESGQELDDEIINAVQGIFKAKYPSLQGLRDTAAIQLLKEPGNEPLQTSGSPWP